MLRKWSKNFGNHPNETINFFNKINYSCYAVKKKKGGGGGCKENFVE